MNSPGYGHTITSGQQLPRSAAWGFVRAMVSRTTRGAHRSRRRLASRQRRPQLRRTRSVTSLGSNNECVYSATQKGGRHSEENANYVEPESRGQAAGEGPNRNSRSDLRRPECQPVCQQRPRERVAVPIFGRDNVLGHTGREGREHQDQAEPNSGSQPERSRATPKQYRDGREQEDTPRGKRGRKLYEMYRRTINSLVTDGRIMDAAGVVCTMRAGMTTGITSPSVVPLMPRGSSGRSRPWRRPRAAPASRGLATRSALRRPSRRQPGSRSGRERRRGRSWTSSVEKRRHAGRDPVP